MSDLLITTTEELHQKLLALPATAFGDTHSTCLIGRACEAVYGHTSYSFEECGYPVDVAEAVAQWNDELHPDCRQQLVPLLPHPSETAELCNVRQCVALALWAARQTLPLLPDNVDLAQQVVSALDDMQRFLAGESLDADRLAAIAAFRASDLVPVASALETLLEASDDSGDVDQRAACGSRMGQTLIESAYAVREAALVVGSEQALAVAKMWLTGYFSARAEIIAQYPEEGVS